MKEFKDILVGQSFMLNGLKYTKVNEQRINCCKSINATASDNVSNRIFVAPSQQVEEVVES